MATVSYKWSSTLGASTFLSTNTELTGDQTNPVVTALEDGSGFFAAWDQPGFELVDGRLVGDDNTPLSLEYLLNSTTTNNQFNPSLATLNNGNMVLTFTDDSSDPDGDIRARLFTPDGTAVDLDFEVIATANDDSDSNVAALADGGFVVTYTRDFGAGERDIRAAVFNSDGSVRTSFVSVDQDAPATDSNSAQVAGLANGNFVVVWEQEPALGGDSEVYFRLFDASGTALDDGILIDTAGSINEDIQVVALQDGGFAVAYADNFWGAGTDIVFRIYNADGTPRSQFQRVNSLENGGETTGDQYNPTLTVLSNGYIAVGWTDDAGNLTYQAYDANGAAIGSNTTIHGEVTDVDIAGLSGGLLANVRSSTGTDGSGGSILSSVHALVRTTMGDGTSETLKGDSLRDAMYGLGGKDTLIGGAGDDVLEGGSGSDRLTGGSGLDTASYKTAAAGVNVDLALTGAQNTGGAGADTLISIEGISGGNFKDTLKGNAQANVIFGGSGDDIIEGRGGNDTLDGGSGNNTASYASAASGVTVSLAFQGKAQNTGGAGTDRLISFWALTGSKFNDVLTGDLGNNVLKGGAGRDRLVGADGSDTLDGGTGNDTLNGGKGNDWASYASAGSGVKVNLGLASAQNTGGGGIDRLIDIEHLIGSKFNDRLTGNGGPNRLTGGAGKDTLIGGDSSDTLDGGSGNDIMNGGADTDVASYASAGSGVTVSLAIATAQNTGGGGVDRLSGIEWLIGSKFNDRLTGNGSDNDLRGGAGKDTLSGGGGDDGLDGGAGNDVMNGGAGGDVAIYQLATSGVTVDLGTVGAQNTGGAGIDTLSNIENLFGSSFDDNLTGNSGGNLLLGFNGSDTMSGGGSDDKLIGGAGADQLTGGGGSDRFRFESLSDSGPSLALSDLITDFGAGDKIDLFAIDADITTPASQAFQLDATPDGAGDIGIAFDAANNRTIITLYVDNNLTADAAIILSGNHSGLTAGDFVL
jgi:Ca2+-binding RTX toxin-like protein